MYDVHIPGSCILNLSESIAQTLLINFNSTFYYFDVVKYVFYNFGFPQKRHVEERAEKLITNTQVIKKRIHSEM